MKLPCEDCRERDICQKEGLDECERLKAYKRYKKKCEDIAEKTREIMERAKSK